MATIVHHQDKRRAFIDVLCELAEHDERVVFIIPDVGWNYIEKFSDRFPKRFFNLGVTEQSATIIAAAMALDGMRPYLYSMINFVAFRPFEMVRNAIAMHKAPVTLLGVQGSSAYKFLGFSHNEVFANEDAYHLKPYMDCYTPEDNDAVRRDILASYETGKPCYVRL